MEYLIIILAVTALYIVIPKKCDETDIDGGIYGKSPKSVKKKTRRRTKKVLPKKVKKKVVKKKVTKRKTKK
jgi:hypothetical protein